MPSLPVPSLACMALILTALLLALVTLLLAGLRSARARRAHPPEGRFVTCRGTRIHVLQQGTGPDVVMLHGASVWLRDMQAALAPQLPGSVRLTLIDRPGLGHSQRLGDGRISMREQTAFLEEVVAELGLERFVLVGQSFGGTIAMSWAIHHPGRVAGLVLMAPPLYPWKRVMKKHFRRLARPVLGPVLAQVMAAWVWQRRIEAEQLEEFAPDRPPPGFYRRTGVPLTMRPGALVADARQRVNIFNDLAEMTPHYHRLTLPVELVHGTEDGTAALELHSDPLLAEVPGARLKRLKGVGHLPHHMAPTACAEAIARALRRAGLVATARNSDAA